ncbi:MAG: flagellar motor stator protein MotA [Hydrogenophaga sp.]|uniref:flagellar motor stator protein MotA n=1 Tax=Hydrogenophaga sp. TaxID=1904254 RepID=UPI00261FFD5F|nr:flagellar motor stator protein MotA [Hydrogenophaga sp.]MDM7942433.1 flagellar motor stator protein MotA [Hydrogenophaga sp.]
MTIPLGWIIGMVCVLGGYALHGGHLRVLWQPTEVLTIVGAAVGYLIASNNTRVLMHTMKAVPASFRAVATSKRLYLDLLCLLFEILNRIRRDGLMSLEGDIEDSKASALFAKYPTILKDHHLVEFLTDYLRMMLGGALNVMQIENLMEQELDVHHQVAHVPVTVVQKVADALPAFGIVAAVMGVVHTMGSIGLPPEELGKLIGAALVGTFLGILLAYSVVGPVASVMEQNNEAESKAFLCVKTVLLAHMNGFTPQASVEFGRKILYPDLRPSFQELDDETKAAKAK